MCNCSDKIRDINNKALCICYYIYNVSCVNQIGLSIETQLKYTNIKDFNVLIFTSPELYSTIRNKYKDMIGLTNIIKVNPIFLSKSLLMTHSKIQEYKTCVMFKSTVRINSKVNYNDIIDYHRNFPTVLGCRSVIDKFKESFEKLVKNIYQNTLILAKEEIIDTLFSCYCSRVKKNDKLNNFNIINKIPCTEILSFATNIVRTPTFNTYIKNLVYSGIKQSNLAVKLYADAKGYRVVPLNGLINKTKLKYD